MDMTDEKSIENQLSSHQKIKRNFLHQASSKDLVKSQPNLYQVFTFSVNAFGRPRPHQNLLPDFWISQFRSAIRKGTHHNDCRYAHNLKLLINENAVYHQRGYGSDPQKDYTRTISLTTVSFSHIQKLDLTFFGYNAMGDNFLILLGTQIGRRLTSLQYLSLTLRDWAAITDQGLAGLFKELCKNLAHLTVLNLDLSLGRAEYLRRFTDQGVKVVASEIARWLLGLRSLSVDFSNRKGISSQGVQGFISRISRIRKLEKLRFYFPNQIVSEEVLKILLKAICQNLSCLRHLEFKSSYSSDIPAKSFWLVLAEISQHLVHLEHLSFDFISYDMETSEEHSSYIYNQMDNLKILDLTLRQAVTYGPTLVALPSIITKNFPNLEHLTLVFKGVFRPLSQASLEALIFNTSCSLKKLHTLCLEFYNYNLQGADWKKWEEPETEKSLSSLKNLSLKFNNCGNTFEAFLGALGTRTAFYLSNLESLTLIFERCTTGKGLIALGERIRESLVNLKTFGATIRFENYKAKEELENTFGFVENLKINIS